MRCKRIVKTAGILGIAAIVFLGNLSGTMQTVHGEEYEYDALNRVVKVIYEDGSYVEYFYDSNGNIVKITMHTDQPEESDKPENPGAPTDPEEPGTPGQPSEPDKPEVPAKPWRPIRDDRTDEADESDEQTEAGTSGRNFDFGNPFDAQASENVGNTGNTEIDKKAAEARTDAKGDQPAEKAQAKTFTPLEPETSLQEETAQEGMVPDNSNASDAGTIGLFQLLVIFFQAFFMRILQWLAQVV